LSRVTVFGASFVYWSTSESSSGNDADTTTENNDDHASSAAAAVVNANLRMIMLNGQERKLNCTFHPALILSSWCRCSLHDIDSFPPLQRVQAMHG
jgi:hypothetical protein